MLACLCWLPMIVDYDVFVGVMGVFMLLCSVDVHVAVWCWLFYVGVYVGVFVLCWLLWWCLCWVCDVFCDALCEMF